MEEKLTETREFLLSIQQKVYLKDFEIYEPGLYHIDLQLKKNHRDPGAYMQYDPYKKKILGWNPELKGKLKYFLSKTNNHHLLIDIENNLHQW